MVFLRSPGFVHPGLYRKEPVPHPLAGGSCGMAKDTVYRFLNSVHTNWRRYLLLVSSRVTRSVFDLYNIVSRDDLKEAAIEALNQGIRFYAPLSFIWQGYTRVHRESDPKHPNGNPAIIHTFELRIN
jgi:hypothetical protein